MSNPALGHEKLQVYQYALRFVTWKEDWLTQTDTKAAAIDHLDRASEGIAEELANGNSRWSEKDRQRHFDVAVGSALECAACLDVCGCKGLLPEEDQIRGKGLLRSIVCMTIALSRARDQTVLREDEENYCNKGTSEPLFSHERLRVYQLGLSIVYWADKFLREHELPSRYACGLDKATTGIVLNIAEGNGRYALRDHRRFLDIAQTEAMKTASRLDILVAKGLIRNGQIEQGKQLIEKLVRMLMGLRKHLSNV